MNRTSCHETAGSFSLYSEGLNENAKDGRMIQAGIHQAGIHMEKSKRVILVSGMSGAGKSTATSILEDMGYHIIENFPVQLISLLDDIIENSIDPRYSYLALSTNANDFREFLRGIKGDAIDVRVLFLDASDTVLIRRYKSSRRNHPLLLSNSANTLEEAIAVERQILSQSLDASFVTIDTSYLTPKEVKRILEQYFSKSAVPTFSISFISFGYKFGVPLDADLMIDVRFLPNPFWEPQLRPYNGNDPEIYNYVMNSDQTQEFLKRLTAFLDYAFEEYVKEGKNHFTVAIGCTGGQHRSVTVANYLYNHYRNRYHSYISHRDEKEWIKNE